MKPRSSAKQSGNSTVGLETEPRDGKIINDFGVSIRRVGDHEVSMLLYLVLESLAEVLILFREACKLMSCNIYVFFACIVLLFRSIEVALCAGATFPLNTKDWLHLQSEAPRSYVMSLWGRLALVQNFVEKRKKRVRYT
jgi:hypothetical protein